MDHTLYNWIGSVLIFGIALYLGIYSLRAITQLMKTKGVSLFMSRSEIKKITDPMILEALAECKKKLRMLFLIWIITGALYLILSMVIDRTIGFKN